MNAASRMVAAGLALAGDGCSFDGWGRRPLFARQLVIPEFGSESSNGGRQPDHPGLREQHRRPTARRMEPRRPTGSEAISPAGQSFSESAQVERQQRLRRRRPDDPKRPDGRPDQRHRRTGPAQRRSAGRGRTDPPTSTATRPTSRCGARCERVDISGANTVLSSRLAGAGDRL